MSDAMTLADTPQPASESTLDQISMGERVRVRSVAGDDAIARRLGELGVRRGIEIEVMKRAPLGDPTLFELCGYQLCLRRNESARIQVEPLAPAVHNSRANA
jgi:ferrous iron transport protein A